MIVKAVLTASWLLVSTWFTLDSAAQTAAPCQTAQACLERFVERAKSLPPDAAHPTLNDRVVIRRYRELGGDDLTALFDLLADPSDGVARLSAEIIGDLENPDTKFLPKVLAGLDRGLSSLKPVLGRMDSEAAASEAVTRYLTRVDVDDGWVDVIQFAGRRAIPAIVDAARCESECRYRFRKLGEALGAMGSERAAAAEPLLALALKEGVSVEISNGALGLIGALGPDGLGVQVPLTGLINTRPDLKAGVEEALIGIGASAAGDVIAERLRNHPNVYSLRELAELGAAGISAGPTVVSLLDNEDWDIRLEAARALGLISYAESSSALRDAIKQPEDVRLSMVAAQSLGRLRAVDGTGDLEILASTHWYPPVRAVATTALRHIRDGRPYNDAPGRGGNEHPYWNGSIHSGLPDCSKPDVIRKYEPPATKFQGEEAIDTLRRLTYQRKDPWIPQPPGSPPAKVIDQIPDVALRVVGGWLTGTDRGEWTGELMFIDDAGTQSLIMNANVEDLYAFGDGVIALTGYAHLDVNEGMVSKLVRVADGTWRAKPWRVLPGVPMASWLTTTDELFVSTSGGGGVLIARDGTLRAATCRND